MAKVSKVNVSITGDSSGLAKATDQATANMRRLRAEGEATRKRLGEMKSSANQTAEAIAKLGVNARGLQAVGGIMGLGSMGVAGLKFAALGATLGAVTAVASAYQDLATEAEAARKAQEAVARGESWRKYGFTPEGGMALAARPPEPAAIGFGRGISQTLAIVEGDTGKRGNLQNIAEYAPGAIGSILGGLAAGGVVEGKDIAQAIGQTEYRRLRGSLEETLPFTMSVVDFAMDIGHYLFAENSK